MKTKTLILDIETLPLVAASWSIGECRLTHDMILDDPSIFMIQWKWKGEKTVHITDITDFKGWEKDYRNDKKLLEVISKQLEKAEVVIGQNSKRFDEKWIRAKLLKHGLLPQDGYLSRDLLISSRKHFRLTSHKLDYIARFLGIGAKVHTDLSWWMELVRSGINKDWKTFKKRVNMFKKYGKMDVILAEKVYDKMLPFCTEWKNHNTASGSNKCECGGSLKKNGTRYMMTEQCRYQRYICNKCGKSCRGKKNLISSKDKLD